MHLLMDDVLRPHRSLGSTLLSIALHGGVVVVLALTGQQVVDQVRNLIEESVQYLLPMDRAIGHQRPGQESAGASAGQRAYGTAVPKARESGSGTARASGVARDGMTYTPWPSASTESEPALGEGTYSMVDVDSVATRDPSSAGPEYPPALILRHVEGTAMLRFEVDSTGLVDMKTVRVMFTSHPLFAKAVIDVLPRMKFRPARIGDMPVRQLVDQPFIFRIEKRKARTS